MEGSPLNQPITYRPGTRIRKTLRHGQVLCIEIGAPCDVRVRSTTGAGNRYIVTIDAVDVDDSAEAGDTG